MKRRNLIKKKIKNLLNFSFLPGQRYKRKIFCLSMQRTGTTSVGDFLSDHNIRVARYVDSLANNWTYKWHLGDYESIFNSISFKSFQAYEDDPWWMPDFYRVIYNRFPGSNFILFYRNSDDWFNSMVKHSHGRTIGNTYRHCRTYRRLKEFYHSKDNNKKFIPNENGNDNLMFIKEHNREHYKDIYEENIREIIEYFNKYSPSQLFVCDLYDSKKWQKLGKFLNLSVDNDYDVHSHQSI
jgi:hypothetical protein